MITWFRRYLVNRRARASLRWLLRHWLPAWATLPGAHRDVPPPLTLAAQAAANAALDGRAWRHHVKRLNASGDPSMLVKRDVIWGVAMRCARSAWAHAAEKNDLEATARVRGLSGEIDHKAGRLDPIRKPLEG